MDYDFSTLCNDQLEKVAKRLEALNKSFVKEYKLALNVINNQNVSDHYNEILTSVEDLFRDQVNKASIFYTETLNKVQRELGKHLK